MFWLTDPTLLPCHVCRVTQRKLLARLARKQQKRFQTKALLVWKLVLIARGLFEHQQYHVFHYLVYTGGFASLYKYFVKYMARPVFKKMIALSSNKTNRLKVL